MSGYPVVFSEMKAKVGVTDVAAALGYTVDRKAGVGRYVELCLGDHRNPTDRIVVRNSADKSQQTFFRRDGSKGDALTLIRENLNSFNVPGTNEWTRIANVMAQLANVNVPLQVGRSSLRSDDVVREFDPARYQVAKMPSYSCHRLLSERGFDASTVAAMGDSVVLIRDSRNTAFRGHNIGFPYTRPDDDSLAGYEIRGAKGFKSKAAGTDSAHSAWMADFPPGNPGLSRNVFFFESAFDAMAFYQLNRAWLTNAPFSMVSVGGSFSESLAKSVVDRYPNAQIWACFDNDVAGRQFTVSLINAKDGLRLDPRQADEAVWSANGPVKGLSTDPISVKLYSSPRDFKDWNDCLLGKRMTPPAPSPSKHDMTANLRASRAAAQSETSNSLKL